MRPTSWPNPPASVPTCAAKMPAAAWTLDGFELPQSIQFASPLSMPPFATRLREEGSRGAARPAFSSAKSSTSAKPLPAFFHTYTSALTAFGGAITSRLALVYAVLETSTAFWVKAAPEASMKLTPTYTVSDATLTLACAVSRYVLPGTMLGTSWPAPPASLPTRSAEVPVLACPEATLALPQFTQPAVPLSNPAFETRLPAATAVAKSAEGAVTDCCARANSATGFGG